MVLEGYKVLDSSFTFQNVTVSFSDTIDEMIPSDSNVFKGYIIPGLCDVHTHGAVGHGLMKMENVAAYEAYLQFMYSKGITTFYPTSVSCPIADLGERVSFFAGKEEITGIHIEGPFINAQYKGAHQEEHITEAYTEALYVLQEKSGGKIRLITVAPEIGQNTEFIMHAAQMGVHVSLGHSGCDYQTAMTAIDAGADHITHLFNAMPPFHHRNSGLIGAAFDSDAYCELIADGIHVCPEVVRMVYRAIGDERLLLISDSMIATGLADGVYNPAGFGTVTVKDGMAYYSDGVLAGSTKCLYDMVLSANRMGIPFEKAVKMASYTPAKSVGETKIGVLEVGKRADMVILDKDYSVLQTIRGGKLVYSVF